MARMLAANHEQKLTAATDLEQTRHALSRLDDRRQAEEFIERVPERLSRSIDSLRHGAPVGAVAEPVPP